MISWCVKNKGLLSYGLIEELDITLQVYGFQL